MFLLFLGVIIVVFTFFLAKAIPQTPKGLIIVRFVGFLMIIIGFFSSFIVQVDAGKLGVKKLFGKVQNDVLESGLHFVNPLVEVVTFDIRTQNYTMSGVHDEGNTRSDDAIKVLSADGLEVIVDLTVLFRVSGEKAPDILREIGTDYINVIVRPVTRTKIRDNAVYYDAVSLYSTKRDEFQNKIFKTIDDEFNKRGLVLEQLLVRNLTLPTSVKQAIESKINAEQEAQKMEFVLQKEKQEAERKRVEAQGIADYHKIISSGLNEKQLQYETIKMQKELATSANSKIIIMGGKGNIPLMLTDK
ncbi:MAG: prohibitin family protein [Cytophagales bacterium]